ncbi:MAG: PilN domain-containing protein [Proteobacteria bacterium]|nr:PilN domain-containing protein [Pseudomonadota bacterium]
MIRINLLPVRQIKQRIRTRQEVIGLVSAVVVLLGVIVLMGFGQASKISSLQAESARLNQELAKYQAIITQIENIKKAQMVIETKLGVIKALKVSSQLPTRILDEVATLTPPDRMWLNSLDYTNDIITLAGIALDNATIAEYMDKISKSDFFVAAELKNSSLTKVGNQKLKAFSMIINAVAPARPAPAPVAGGVK